MSRYVPLELRSKVQELFAGRCAYCQTSEMLTVVTFEVEHIQPLSFGGETVLSNLCLACPACNRFKSNKTSGQTSKSKETQLFHPQLDRWHDHFDWSIGGTHIVALTEIGEVTVSLLRMNRSRMVEVRAMWVEAGKHPPV